jgi:MoxR-like ATPase
MTPELFAKIPVPPTADAVTEVPLDPYGSLPATRHILDRASALALKAALAAERPLLLRGEPGTGKSQLARAAAALLERHLLVHAVDARTETRDLLYTIDAVSRLAHAQLAGAMHASRDRALEHIDMMLFVQPGPLWWAYNPAGARAQAKRSHAPLLGGEDEAGDARGVVLLIDEIDKADPSVPNGLLDAFGGGCFHVEGRFAVTAAEPRPLVILTTNEERALPDAFVRRCLVHTIELPRLPEEHNRFVEVLVARGKANLDGLSKEVLKFAAELIAAERVARKGQGVCLPGVAEYIDLLRAVQPLAPDDNAQKELLQELQRLVTRKHPLEGAG